MSLLAAALLFFIIWFMCLFVILPLRLKSQHETGEISPGTPASAPSDPKLKQKMKWVTLLAIVVWGIIVAIIMSHIITVQDLDFFHRM